MLKSCDVLIFYIATIVET